MNSTGMCGRCVVPTRASPPFGGSLLVKGEQTERHPGQLQFAAEEFFCYINIDSVQIFAHFLPCSYHVLASSLGILF